MEEDFPFLLRIYVSVVQYQPIVFNTASGVRRKKFLGGSRLWPASQGVRETQPPPGGRRIFENLQKNFLRKLKNVLFYHIFQKNLTNHALIFRAFGRKTQILGKFCDIFENFQKISLENFEKSIILAYSLKNLTNHTLIFRAFG